jgi:DNA-binding FadR family transcriptional regulator
MDRPHEFASVMTERAKDTVLEHRRIVEAIALRDPEFAVAAMRSHLTNASQALESVLARLEKAPQKDA